VEEAAGRSVSDIFADFGEAAFRDGERRVIARLVEESGRTVIALGGGAFVDPQTRTLLKERALSVWLQADIDTLMTATTRDPAKAKSLAAQDITPVLTDDEARLTEAVEAASHIIVSAPPGEAGDPFLPALDVKTLQERWVGYLSTTGVYGDRRGGWAFEWDAVHPTQARSVRRVQAETGWQAAGARIFRLSGIYGPGSSALDALCEGRARRIIKPGHGCRA